MKQTNATKPQKVKLDKYYERVSSLALKPWMMVNRHDLLLLDLVTCFIYSYSQANLGTALNFYKTSHCTAGCCCGNCMDKLLLSYLLGDGRPLRM